MVLLPDVDGGVTLLPDAELHWRRGRITAVQPASGPGRTDLVLLPGFVDLHCHWPQAHVRGAFSGQLLPWLQQSIWPAEAAFADPAVAHARAERFLADAIGAGTCAALLFGSPFLEASLAFQALAPVGYFDGPALMEVEAPAALLRPVVDVLRAVADLPGPVRDRVVVSPRFAPNLTAEGLAAAGRTAASLDLFSQSHVSENLDEIAWVRSLFPDARDYVDVYDRAGLLGPRCVLAHAVHCSDRELARLAATGTVVAHCPTSNEALGSGRMPLERLRNHGVRWVLATDVGAGPHLSQLDAVRAALQVHVGHVELSPSEALCRVTAIPGAFLAGSGSDLAGLGTLQPGAPAHIVAYTKASAANAADDVVRHLTSGDRAALDTLPRQVVLWGHAQQP